MDTRLANAAFCCDADILYVFTVVYYRYMLRFTQRQRNYIWKQCFHSEQRYHVFRPLYTGEI